MYEVLLYKARDDADPVQEFLDGLGKKPRAKAAKFMALLAVMGPDLPRPYADVLRDKIRELRVPYGSLQIRLLYFFAGQKIIMTNGFLKKTGKIPSEEIDRAVRRMADWLSRESE
jgi:phage-related protein